MAKKITIHPEMMIRVPQFHLNAKIEDEWENLKQSIKLSSLEFYELIKDVPSVEINKLPPPVYHTLWKYFNRSKYRATPYGNFAAFGLTQSEKSKGNGHIVIEDSPITHSLICWGNYNQLISSKISLRDETLLFANSSYYKIGNKIRYLVFTDNVFGITEIEIVPWLLEILEYCRKPISFENIKTEVELPKKAHRLINDMVQAQLLVTETSPNMIGVDFFERLGIKNNPALTQYVIAERKVINGFPNISIMKELPNLILLLERVMRPMYQDSMDKFKASLLKKFEQREIPLMVALDPELGIAYTDIEETGADNSFVKMFSSKNNTKHQKYDRNLSKLLLSAFAQAGSKPIQLECLESQTGTEIEYLPNSIGILCSIVDDLIILEHAGGANASALAGRFNMVSEQVEQFCNDLAGLEQQANPDVLFFDISYSAEKITDNINRRKPIYPLQLSILNFDTSNNPLTLNDLYLTMQQGELILYSKKYKKRMIPRLTTAYNYVRSDLSVFRFLCDFQFQGITPNLLFNISALVPDIDYYPRVQFKNIIVSPAKWRVNFNNIENNTADPLMSLRSYLTLLGLPRFMVNRTHDRSMYFDAQSDNDLTALYYIFKKFKSFYLEEGFVPEDSTIKDDSGNSYANQILLSLSHDKEIYKGIYIPVLERRSIPSIRQNFTAGSEWLYYEIFSHQRNADYLLNAKLCSFLKSHKQKLACWFFIRYNENGDHIRLRMKLKDTKDSGIFMTSLAMLFKDDVEEGLISELILKTYKREIERYGPDLMEDIEVHFSYDSTYVINLIRHGLGDIDKYKLCLSIFDSLREACIFEVSDFNSIIEGVSNSFLQEHTILGDDFKLLNTQYNSYKNHLTIKLPEPDLKRLSQFIASFKNLLIKCPPERRFKLFSDLMHMHVNRLFSDSQRTHEMVVYYFAVKELKYRKAMYRERAFA